MKCKECQVDNSNVKLNRDGIALCSKCLKKGIDSEWSNSIFMGDTLVVNDVLAYAWHYIKCSSFDFLKKTLIQHFQPHEILEAKMALWKICHNKLPSMVSRQDSVSRSAKEAEVIDILNGMKKLDSENENIPLFVASNLSKLPKYGPEELDVTSIVQRLNEVEKKCESIEKIEKTVGENSDSISTLFNIQYETKSYAAKARSKDSYKTDLIVKLPENENCTSFHSKSVNSVRNTGNMDWTRKQPVNNGHNERQLYDSVPPKSTFPSVASGYPGLLNKNCMLGERSVAGSVSGDNKLEIGSNDGFSLTTAEKKRQARKQRRKAVYGKGTGELKSGPRYSDLFVFRLDKYTSDDEVKQHVESKNI